MTDEKRTQLYEALKQYYGSLSEVASRAKVTRQYVNYVLQGKRKSTRILTIACEVLAEKEREEKSMKDRQLSLLAEVEELQAA